MAPADKAVSDITLHFHLLKKCSCDESPTIRGGYRYIMNKLVGCGPGLWVVLLKISWAWNMSNNPSKNALILSKKNPSSIPSCALKIPLHCAQIPLQKWGI
jgi:hypothetical protein